MGNQASSRARPSTNLNVNVPIGVLCDDLLLEIFLISAARTHKSRVRQERNSQLAISQVCRYWRNLSRSTPLLWSTIAVDPYTTKFIVSTFIDLSQNVPLKVAFVGLDHTDWERSWPIDMGNSRLLEATQLLSTKARRICEFSLGTLRPTELMDILSPFMVTPAPALRVLTIDDQYSPSTAIPHRALFSGHMPSLQQLVVKARTVSWLPCAGLTVLELTDQQAPILEDLFATLRDCPGLKTFILRMNGLCSRLQLARTQPQAPKTVIVLPRLRRLTLLGMQQNVVFILKRLLFPDTARIHLGFDCGEVYPTRLHTRCPSLARAIARISTAKLTIVRTDYDGYSVALDSSDGRFRAEWAASLEGFGGVLPQGLPTLCFPEMRRLTIAAAASTVTSDEWDQVLRALVPNLEDLAVAVQAPDTLSEALFLALGRRYPRGLDNLLLPRLVGLDIVKAPLRGTAEHRLLSAIEMCFRYRAEEGTALRRFGITLSASAQFAPWFLARVENDLQKLKRIMWFELGPHSRLPPAERAWRANETLLDDDPLVCSEQELYMNQIRSL